MMTSTPDPIDEISTADSNQPGHDTPQLVEKEITQPSPYDDQGTDQDDAPEGDD